MCCDAGSAAASFPCRHADVNVGRVRSYSSPQSDRRVMTQMCRGGEPLHDRPCSKLQGDHVARRNIGVMEEAVEIWTEQVREWNAHSSRRGSAEDERD